MFTNHLASALLVATHLLGCASSSPLEGFESQAATIIPAINANFPDPSVLQDSDGVWYAFATNDFGHNVQVANATSIHGPWTVLGLDLLPAVGKWSNGANVWAPDVRKIKDKYVLHYSASDATQLAQYCVGTATSDSILGPYTPSDTPLACPLSAGGAIDSSAFTDVDGAQYVVYKVDGNSIGSGGPCGNADEPRVPTPLMLQELADDGATPVGEPIELLDRSDADGPLIEAPNLIVVNGVYFLFFSSNCYNTPLYDVTWATASSVRGPFTKRGPLLVTNNPFELTAPGGATATVDGENLVFHANCDAGRCMYVTGIQVLGTEVLVA